jgi:hypothetical protein
VLPINVRGPPTPLAFRCHYQSQIIPFDINYIIPASDLAKRHAASCIAHTESLYAAACILARGAHRVAVLNDEGQVVNIISQSSIISFLAKHVCCLPFCSATELSQFEQDVCYFFYLLTYIYNCQSGSLRAELSVQIDSAKLGVRPVITVPDNEDAIKVSASFNISYSVGYFIFFSNPIMYACPIELRVYNVQTGISAHGT